MSASGLANLTRVAALSLIRGEDLLLRFQALGLAQSSEDVRHGSSHWVFIAFGVLLCFAQYPSFLLSPEDQFRQEIALDQFSGLADVVTLEE